MVAAVGPAPTGGWCTAYEKDFVSGLGTWCPLALHSKAYKVACLRGYLDSMDKRALKGNVDWSAVRDHALGLLAQAIEEAA